MDGFSDVLKGVSVISEEAGRVLAAKWTQIVDGALSLKAVEAVDSKGLVVYNGQYICGLMTPQIQVRSALFEGGKLDCFALPNVKVRIARRKRRKVHRLQMPVMGVQGCVPSPSLRLEPTRLYVVMEVNLRFPVLLKYVAVPSLPQFSRSLKLPCFNQLKAFEISTHAELLAFVVPEFDLSCSFTHLNRVVMHSRRKGPKASMFTVDNFPLELAFSEPRSKSIMANVAFLRNIDLMEFLTNDGWLICERLTKHSLPTIYLSAEQYLIIADLGNLPEIDEPGIVVVESSGDGLGL